jgi:hypothetical protein
LIWTVFVFAITHLKGTGRTRRPESAENAHPAGAGQGKIAQRRPSPASQARQDFSLKKDAKTFATP